MQALLLGIPRICVKKRAEKHQHKYVIRTQVMLEKASGFLRGSKIELIEMEKWKVASPHKMHSAYCLPVKYFDAEDSQI
jgi:hypothetical protein